MSTEENKAIARRLVEEVLNKGNMAALEEYFASNYVDHTPPPGVPPGLEGVKMFFGAFRALFPTSITTSTTRSPKGTWWCTALRGTAL